MEVISQDAIVKMFEKCSALPRYRVGFCFSTERAAKEFLRSMLQIFNEDGIPGVSKIYSLYSGGQIKFNSDSCIDIFTLSYIAKGQRLHDIYWDESIEYKFDDKIQNYFSSLLISYHGIPIPEAKHTDWTDSADTTELDAFLNSFRITHNI